MLFELAAEAEIGNLNFIFGIGEENIMTSDVFVEYLGLNRANGMSKVDERNYRRNTLPQWTSNIYHM